MAGLTWHNFVSAAAGLGVALALARGFTRHVPADGPKTLGNFWVDLIRAVVYVLMPLSVVTALALVAGGLIQNLSPYLTVTTLEGGSQVLALGPTASQIAIKQLGTNGGGFFNVNSAHPFENATAITNFIECLAILVLPAAQVYMYGLMARSTKQGWAIIAAMGIMFFMGISACYWAEARGNAIVASVGASQPIGNMEGKETRFGVASSTLWAVATTDASNGSVNSMHDSYTPLGGLVPLVNIELGEVDLRRRGCRPLRDPRDGRALGVHRRAHGRQNSGVSRQEDRGARDEARDALRADLPVHHSRLLCLGRGRVLRRGRR